MLHKASLLFFLGIIFLVSCKKEKQEEGAMANTSNYYQEPYRPQYHFSPEAHWMNDPNGLVFYKDTYHLFYQYYPEDTKWGPMHWGHATSNNLKDWTHKRIALYPDSLGYIFSGSAVVDLKNTSGFGTKENPPLVAMFTYHDAKAAAQEKRDYQYQGIAYSIDEGDTWIKYSGNPVVPNPGDLIDFRDPKVFWFERTQDWRLLLVAGDHLRIYSSKDLKDWKMLSEFGRDKGAHGGVWECPDLFPLQVGDEEKWVLFISINPGAPNGGSGTQYFVGDFDGTTFKTDQEEKWLDLGMDNYAGVTFNGLQDDDRVFIGWMSNWLYGQQTPTETWRSAMTLPRKLALHKGTDYIVSSYPEYAITKDLDYITAQTKNNITDPLLNQSNIKFDLTRPLRDFRISLSNAEKDSIFLGYDAKKEQFYIDRSKSGITDFGERFADRIMVAPQQMGTGDKVCISLFLDHSSLEFFVDEGMTAMTAQFFPKIPYTKFDIETFDPPQILYNAHIPGIWKQSNSSNQ